MEELPVDDDALVHGKQHVCAAVSSAICKNCTNHLCKMGLLEAPL